ncbi:hypothetical protein [Halorussus salinisoli]|uniref:hypothetical protein n=1 Tax=Halorussus salinisoli TaxID=2558242 RepID=UPI0010C23344|nr:hypothetical protein [Halorussus salinisoli]
MTNSPSRRSVLETAATCSLVALAGCVSSEGDGEQSSRPDSATADATDSSTPEWVDCDEVESPPNPADTDEVAPKTYPDFPARLARSSVTEFVTAYERVYKHNEILARERNLTYVDVGRVEVSDAERTDEGFVVYVTVEFGWGEGGGSDDETATSLHADGGSKVSYFVGERALKRVEPDEWKFADPRTTAGAVLRCRSATTTE